MSRNVDPQKSGEVHRSKMARRVDVKRVGLPSFSPGLSGSALNRAICKEALRVAGSNRDKAIALLRDWMLADFKLNQRVALPLVDLSLRQELDDLIRATRPVLRYATAPPSASLRNGIAIAAQENIMNFPVFLGLRLGDCTDEDLIAGAV